MDNKYVIGMASDPGIKRKNQPNEDAIGIVTFPSDGSRAPLLILSDGMGGYNGGEIASNLAVKAISEYWRHADQKKPGYPQNLNKCISAAQASIVKRAAGDPSLNQMGATIVIAALLDSCVQIANVGDSRAYWVSSTGEISQISYDHSFVMDQVREGFLTRDEALHHPRRNILSMSLTGQREEIEPYFSMIRWRAGDHILLCSDGLWETVTESQISDIVTSLDPQEAADKLIKMANMNQGPDNISVIIARNDCTGVQSSGPTNGAVSSQPVTGEDKLADQNETIAEKDQNTRKIILLILFLLLFVSLLYFILGLNQKFSLISSLPADILFIQAGLIRV